MINDIERLKRVSFAISEKQFSASEDVERTLGYVSETDMHPRLVYDKDYTIIHANKKFLNALGYDYMDLIGKKFMEIKNGKIVSDFITEKYLKPSVDVVIKNLENGIIYSTGIVNEWYHKDGHAVAIEWQKGFNDSKTGYGTAQCKFI